MAKQNLWHELESKPLSMSRKRKRPVESVSSILSCTYEEYEDWFDGPISTDSLCLDAHNLIETHRPALREASEKHRLDNLLTAMLDCAISSDGKRYVAVVIHIAHTKDREAVVNIAKAWMEHLFFPSEFNLLSGTM